ncbi:MAG: Crp/Fnr family transcriptional regulator [Acidimicrobiia bacterium]
MDAELLNVLAEDDRRELVRLARRRRFARGEVIFHEGDPGDALHLIAQGHVGIRTTTPLGDVAMLRVLRAGEFFGELALISPNPRNATAVALDKTETLSVSRALLDELRSRSAGVDAVVIEALAKEVRRLARSLTDALYLPSETRMLHRLVDVAEIFGDHDDGPVTIPLTQDELAQLAGVTRPTANRLLKKAEEDGLIRVTRGRVEILDRAALTHAAR